MTTSGRRATFAPGTYEFIASAPGYGAVRFRKTFKADINPTIALRFAPNLASTAKGAQATGDAAPVIGPTGAVVQDGPQVLAGQAGGLK